VVGELIPEDDGLDDRVAEGDKSLARAALFETLQQGLKTERVYGAIIDAVGEALRRRLAADGFSDKQAVGAVNQYRGMWFEDLVVLDWHQTVAALLTHEPDALVAVPMPKRTELKLESLWVPSIQELVVRLEQDLKLHETVMRASNPDLILVKASTLGRHCPTAWNDVCDAADELSRILAVSRIASELRGKLDYHELKGVMSLKTSLRVDRKVQPLQEANRIKALRKYIRTRTWQREDSPFGFFVALMQEGKGRLHSGSPEIFYSNVLLYSIVAIDEKPSAAVDGVLRVTSTSGLRSAVSRVQSKLMP
jgi:hypothetical protein